MTRYCWNIWKERIIKKILIIDSFFRAIYKKILFSTAHKNEETILFVKQGQDGISMDEFLSDRNYNQTLNISNIVQKKLNYKSQLMDRIFTDHLESVSLIILQAHICYPKNFSAHYRGRTIVFVNFFNQKDSYTLWFYLDKYAHTFFEKKNISVLSCFSMC